MYRLSFERRYKGMFSLLMMTLEDLLRVDWNDEEYRSKMLKNSLNEFGFVVLKNVGSKFTESYKKAYDATYAFFEGLMEELYHLESFETPGSQGERGLFRPGAETAIGAEMPDKKWFLRVGPPDFYASNGDLAKFKDKYNDEIYKVNIPEKKLKESLFSYYQEAAKLGREVLENILIGLDIKDKKEILEATYGANHVMSPTFYPAAKEQEIIAHAHEDSNCLTVLAQPGPGLQLKSGGEFVDIIANEGDVVINVGGMLSRITGLPSTIHRVVSKGEGNRLTIPFFLHLLGDYRFPKGGTAEEYFNRVLNDRYKEAG